MKRLRCTCLLLLTLLLGCSDFGERSRLPEAACAIALDHLKRFEQEARRPIAVWRSSQQLAPSKEQIRALMRQNPKDGDPSEVAQALAESEFRDVSVVDQCSTVRAWLSAEKILHDDRLTRDLIRQEEWSVATIAISAPVLSGSGDLATFYVAEYWGSLAGGVSHFEYRRNSKGGWFPAHETLVSIS